MSTSAIGVGIVGAAATPTGWAAEAHVPAVAAVDDLDLVAVATRSQESADKAAAAFGAAGAYPDAESLVADPAVDLVVVASPVPTHGEVVKAALAAGKHVYSEWPLTPELGTTAALAERAAATAGVHTAIGLQAASAPAAVVAARLIAEGRIGRVLDASVLSTTAAFGGTIPAAARALEEPATGMHLLTIQAAHTLDLVQRLLGPLAVLSAQLTTRFPEVAVEGEDTTIERTLPDHVLVDARAGGGVPVAFEVAGGRPPGATPFALEVTGESGTLTLRGGAARGFQAGRLELLVDGRAESVDEDAALPDSVANVASAYARLAADIRDGAHRVPSFTDAERIARLIGDVRTSDAEGRRLVPAAAAG